MASHTLGRLQRAAMARLPHTLRRLIRQRRPHPTGPGGLFVCEARRFGFVGISKNASTTLKRLIFALDYPGEPAPDDIHAYFREGPGAHHRFDLDDPAAPARGSVLRLAVYREPIDRLMSFYDHQVIDQPVNDYIDYVGIPRATVDEFLAFVAWELKKRDALAQDAHIRRASASYSPADVDHIVPITRLDGFLRDVVGIDSPPRRHNVGRPRTTLTPAQRDRVQKLYRADYRLLDHPKVYR